MLKLIGGQNGEENVKDDVLFLIRQNNKACLIRIIYPHHSIVFVSNQ